jgi:hypothetical protein
MAATCQGLAFSKAHLNDALSARLPECVAAAQPNEKRWVDLLRLRAEHSRSPIEYRIIHRLLATSTKAQNGRRPSVRRSLMHLYVFVTMSLAICNSSIGP